MVAPTLSPPEKIEENKLKDAEAVAQPKAAPAADSAAKQQETTGEKFYDVLQFTVGKAAIITATAALAFTARYGKDSYGPVPNYLKKFEQWFHKKLLTNKVVPLAEKGEFGERLAGAIANTTVLVHGGNAFAPIMKEMENNHEKIATAVNEKWGKPGEAEISHEKLKDKPKQTWGDIIKGRSASWVVVFASFMGVDTLIGKDKKTGMYWFDKFEESAGRWLAGLSRGGKDIAKVPVGEALSKTQEANKVYRFGKIAALDVFATSAAIIIWNAVSRSSAEKRQKSQQAEHKAALDLPSPLHMPMAENIAEPSSPRTELVTPKAVEDQHAQESAPRKDSLRGITRRPLCGSCTKPEMLSKRIADMKSAPAERSPA